MNPVRKLVDDLIAKKLWPVALALVVAAIAIPVLIAGSGGDAGSDVPDPSFALSAPSKASTSPAVELVGPPAVRSRSGAVRDPFRRKKVAVPAETTAAQPASSGAAGSGAAGSGAAGSSATSAAKSTGAAKSSGAKVGSGKPATTAPDPKPAVSTATTTAAARSAYQTVVRFTRPGGTRERPLARLAVLGNSASPALQYLGVSSDRRHAIFVLGAQATADAGEGACVVADPCRAVALGLGEKLGVDVVGEDLAVRRYVVEVTRLRRLAMPTAARARAWRARVDPVGGAVRRTLREDPAVDSVFKQLRYAATTGTVRLITAP